MRVCDPGLTEVGEHQANYLAKHLAKLPLTGIYCSGFRRSIETAAAIATVLDCPAYVHSQLFEVKGCYSGFQVGQLRAEPGLGRTQILEKYPTWEIDHAIDDRGWFYGRSVESDTEADQRAEAVRDWMIGLARSHQQSDKPVDPVYAMVIHADFKVKLLSALASRAYPALQKTPPWYINCPFNTSITTVQVFDDGCKIVQYNDVPHLPAALVTD